MIIDAAEIINSIRNVYQRDTFTMGELSDILRESGYSLKEIRVIVHHAFNKNIMGKVSYQNLGSHIPSYNSFVVLRPKPKPKQP